MMSHAAFVALSYAATTLTIFSVVLFTWREGRARQRELAELEARGIRRRSEQVRRDTAPS